MRDKGESRPWRTLKDKTRIRSALGPMTSRRASASHESTVLISVGQCVKAASHVQIMLSTWTTKHNY